MLGPNAFIGTTGVLTTIINDKTVEFFRIREIFRVRSEGSYLAVDCDIKDHSGKRLVKLAKNNPAVVSDEVKVTVDKMRTEAFDEAGNLIIRVLQEKYEGPVKGYEPIAGKAKYLPEELQEKTLDAVISITGNFSIGDYLVEITDEFLSINDNQISGSMASGTGGLLLTANGFGF